MPDTAQLHRQTQVIERITECVRRARAVYLAVVSSGGWLRVL